MSSKPTENSVQQILFDADGVVQVWAPGSVARVRNLPSVLPADVEASPYADATQLQDAFLQAVFAAEKPCAIGVADFAEQLELLRQQWKVQLPLAQVLEIWQAIEPIQPMFALIERFTKAGVPCHLATNQQSYRADYMRVALSYDDHFQRSFYSCDMGVAKPEPDYFRAIVQALGVAPATLLFVDDRADNVAAAASVGLQALVFDARLTQQPDSAFTEAVSHLLTVADSPAR